ncbi:MAG: CPXCG motif-containing cysteine-rich protein [Candidatus Methylumidiphilus alinenensis]|uniref:CPXCG motif-containing cysteine-rich protein n=1 Tax=Candidatus Methylumidiphilus alinenensis TaxID=2202197 RepID=A0A2W4RJI5_9GAMM|nr:MAG: CPXCG motif-containing cysteine-rich protein [Candidatus Methylumidiphilus alinenensis]
MQDQFIIICPYCGESVEIYLEPDVEGNLVQDCEVCCNPWEVNVWTDGEDRHIDVSRTDGSG